MRFGYLVIVCLSVAIGVASTIPLLTFASGAICGIASLIFFLP